jgi:mannose-6-phosphate isomerase-like protein (cupin superfamily)
MSASNSVTASVEVAVDSATAFAIFTDEIGRWWRPGPINWYDSARAIGIRFEPGVGGRWLEIYDDASADVLEIGRITVWEPGARLVLVYCDGGHELDGTEVEVRFAPIEGGTRVTLEHRGWEKLAAELAASKRETKRWGWASILGWYSEWAFWGSPRRTDSLPTQHSPRGYLLEPGAGLTSADVKANQASTGGALTLIESRTTGGAPLHVHSRDDECFYVVEGAITVRCGDQCFEAGPRSFVFLPCGIPHEWDVIGTGVATVLIINVPAGLDDFLREYHAAGVQPDDVKDRIAAKYGITFLRETGQAVDRATAQADRGVNQ